MRSCFSFSALEEKTISEEIEISLQIGFALKNKNPYLTNAKFNKGSKTI